MPDHTQAPITAENLTELRDQAEDVHNLNHAIADARDTGGMSPAIVEALNAAGDRYGRTEWRATTVERIRVLAAWCDLLPLLSLVPADNDPGTSDWHWSVVRCFLAGAGYDAHAALAAKLSSLYPLCPLRADESFDEWEKELASAHQQSGIPASIAVLPWRAVRGLPKISRGDLDTMNLRWVAGVALLHILKHTRIVADQVRVIYRGTASYYRRDEGTNRVASQARLVVSLLEALDMARMDRRNTEHALHSVGTSRAMDGLTFNRLLAARPLTQAPGSLIVGQFTSLQPDPAAEGWFQHGLRLEWAWQASEGRTRTFPGNDDTIMGYAWNLDALEDNQRVTYEAMAAAVPATYDIDAPFAVLANYQPNFCLGWATDPDAYASLVDAVLVMSVMRNNVPTARREYPIMWVLPDVPTPEGSTNQGKTSAVTALAGCMTPGIMVSRPPDSNSAPDIRMVAGMIRVIGTVALDEWAMPRNQSHPLSARNLQSLATGGIASIGEVMENNPSPVLLRQPIVASSKCLYLPEDVRNRSVFLFQRTLTDAERKNTRNHAAVVSGEVALRMRLGALALVEQFDLTRLVATTTGDLRFPAHVTLAAKLYELRTGKAGPGALAAIEQTHREMISYYDRQFSRADDSGLLSEMESGESLQIRTSLVFSAMGTTEVITMQDVLADVDGGRASAGQLLRVAASSLGQSKTVRGMLTDLLGYTPRAPERALAQALTRDLRRLMPKPGDTWPMPDMLGIDGWALLRRNDGAGAILRVSVICTNPSSPHFKAIDESE